MFDIFLWFIWLGLPVAFLVLGTTMLVEKLSTKSERSDYVMYYRQFAFVSVCTLFTFAIDTHIVPLIKIYIHPIVTIETIRILIFPAVLLLGAQLLGGTKPIKISRNFDRYSKLEDNE